MLAHISLDGVVQSPGAANEDPSGNFAHGGWIGPYADVQLGSLLKAKMSTSFDLLLGRKTYEIWGAHWPENGAAWPEVNTAVKFVASKHKTVGKWQPAVFINDDLPAKVAALKQQSGPDLHVWGSSDLIQTLLKDDLIDVFWLMVYPITLGSGKRLFAAGTLTSAFKLTDSDVTSKGVMVVTYERTRTVDR